MTVLPFRATVAPAGLLRCGTALTAATAARDFSRTTGGPRATKVNGHVIRPTLPTLLVAALFLSSCGVPASQYCYVASSATINAVDVGMSAAGDLYKQGKVSEAAKVKLVSAHDVYRPIAKSVVDGCRVLGASEQGKADEAIARMQAAGAHVIELLVATGAK